MPKISSLEIIESLRKVSKKSLAEHEISYEEICRYGHTTARSARADGEMPSMNKFILSLVS